MKKTVSILIILILIGTVGYSVSILTSGSDLEMLKKTINEKSDEVPGLSSFLGTNKINLEVEKEDGSTVIVGMETENGKIKTIGEDGFEDSTMELYISQKTLDGIVSGDYDFEELIDSFNKGEIKVGGGSILFRIKMFFLSIILFLVSLVTKIIGIFSG